MVFRHVFPLLLMVTLPNWAFGQEWALEADNPQDVEMVQLGNGLLAVVWQEQTQEMQIQLINPQTGERLETPSTISSVDRLIAIAPTGPGHSDLIVVGEHSGHVVLFVGSPDASRRLGPTAVLEVADGSDFIVYETPERSYLVGTEEGDGLLVEFGSDLAPVSLQSWRDPVISFTHPLRPLQCGGEDYIGLSGAMFDVWELLGIYQFGEDGGLIEITAPVYWAEGSHWACVDGSIASIDTFSDTYVALVPPSGPFDGRTWVNFPVELNDVEFVSSSQGFTALNAEDIDGQPGTLHRQDFDIESSSYSPPELISSHDGIVPSSLTCLLSGGVINCAFIVQNGAGDPEGAFIGVVDIHTEEPEPSAIDSPPIEPIFEALSSSSPADASHTLFSCGSEQWESILEVVDTRCSMEPEWAEACEFIQSHPCFVSAYFDGSSMLISFDGLDAEFVWLEPVLEDEGEGNDVAQVSGWVPESMEWSYYGCETPFFERILDAIRDYCRDLPPMSPATDGCLAFRERRARAVGLVTHSSCPDSPIPATRGTNLEVSFGNGEWQFELTRPDPTSEAWTVGAMTWDVATCDDDPRLQIANAWTKWCDRADMSRTDHSFCNSEWGPSDIIECPGEPISRRQLDSSEFDLLLSDGCELFFIRFERTPERWWTVVGVESRRIGCIN